MRYKFLEHTADEKFIAYGETVNEMLENCIMAFKYILTEDSISESIKKEIIVESEGYESLIYDLLEEFLFLMDDEGFIPAKVLSIEFSEFKVKVKVTGDNYKNYKMKGIPKAVTYNDMYVKHDKNWECQVVIDM